MLHKKRKPSTFTSSSGFADCKRNATSNNNMLHSKSTYFYRWFGSHKPGKLGSQSDHNFTNEFRWSSPHCEQSEASSDAFYANRTRSSRTTNSCSKITGRTGTYLVPTMCSVPLLLGLGVMINPIANETDKASATTTNILTDSNLGTKVDLIMGDALNTSETVESGVVAYISNSFSVKVEGKADYHISVQAAEGYGSELTGRINKEKINGVGNKVSPANFSDNTWGYNLGLTNTTADTGAYIPYLPPEALAYSTLPVYGTLTAPTYSAADAKDQTDTYNLTFAAKITDYKPADHYETQALLSVVAEAKEIAKFTSMQDFAEAGTCTTMNQGDTVQLKDDRTASGIADQKTYWVTKLKDNKCWMTQNLDLSLAQGDVLKPDDTDVTANYTVPSLGNYRDPGMYVYLSAKANTSLPSSSYSCGDPASTACKDYFSAYTGSIDGDVNAHYLIGNYYTYDVATAGKATDNAGSICPKGWKLPTRAEYDTFRSGLTYDTIRRDPYYFVPAGRYYSGWYSVGSYGLYWSSTVDSSSDAYLLYFTSGGLGTGNDNRTNGASVRCVVK